MFVHILYAFMCVEISSTNYTLFSFDAEKEHRNWLIHRLCVQSFGIECSLILKIKQIENLSVFFIHAHVGQNFNFLMTIYKDGEMWRCAFERNEMRWVAKKYLTTCARCLNLRSACMPAILVRDSLIFKVNGKTFKEPTWGLALACWSLVQDLPEAIIFSTFKTNILYYMFIEHTPFFAPVMSLPIYRCEKGNFLWWNGSFTELLHNMIMTPSKQEYLS